VEDDRDQKKTYRRMRFGIEQREKKTVAKDANTVIECNEMVQLVAK
jgi:hypothetical protein